MGAEENAKILRGGYEAFNSGDMKALAEIFDEDVVWHTPGRSTLASDYEGRDAAFEYFRRLGQETGGTFQADLRTLVASDDLVVGIQRNSAERNGNKLDVDLCLVFQLKDGRITEAWEHFYDLYAWDKFWS